MAIDLSKREVIGSGNIYIDKNVLYFQNHTIYFQNISMISLCKWKDMNSVKNYLKFAGVELLIGWGAAFFGNGEEWLNAIGVLFVLCAAVAAIAALVFALTWNYGVDVSLNSGNGVYIASDDLKSAKELVKTMVECINSRNGDTTYVVNMKGVIIEENHQGDNSINLGTIFDMSDENESNNSGSNDDT